MNQKIEQNIIKIKTILDEIKQQYFQNDKNVDINYLFDIYIFQCKSLNNDFKNCVLELYNDMKIESYKMSLSIFRNTILDLYKDNNFDYRSLIKTLDDPSGLLKITYLAPIYGLDIEQEVIDFCSFQFVKKTYILDYIRSRTENVDFNKFSSFCYLLLENESTDPNNFCVYLVKEYCVKDNAFGRNLFCNERKEIVNFIKFLIDYKELPKFISDRNIHYTNELISEICDKQLCSSIEFNSIKPIELEIILDNPKNKCYWDIYKNQTKNDIQRRIFRAIQWIGISLSESAYNIACTELAFAYESLFKIDQTNAPMTPSIQASIGENVAFICGETLKDRIEILKEFKNFYSIRSSVVHGGDVDKFDDTIYIKMLDLIKKTITLILNKSEYIKCNSLEDITNVIKKYKFRTE